MTTDQPDSARNVGGFDERIIAFERAVVMMCNSDDDDGDALFDAYIRTKNALQRAMKEPTHAD